MSDIYKQFPGYVPMTDEEHKELWQSDLSTLDMLQAHEQAVLARLPKPDTAERDALVADVLRWLKGDTENPIQDANELLWSVHAYLTGGAE